jgi:cation/acetate symporter
VVVSTLWLAVCGAALAPVLLYALYRPGFTARGAPWCPWGATGVTVGALAVSPYVSGAPGSVFPEHDFRIWDVTIPGLVTVPAGFLPGRLGSATVRRRTGGPGRPSGEVSRVPSADEFRRLPRS